MSDSAWWLQIFLQIVFTTCLYLKGAELWSQGFFPAPPEHFYSIVYVMRLFFSSWTVWFFFLFAFLFWCRIYCVGSCLSWTGNLRSWSIVKTLSYYAASKLLRTGQKRTYLLQMRTGRPTLRYTSVKINFLMHQGGAPKCRVELRCYLHFCEPWSQLDSLIKFKKAQSWNDDVFRSLTRISWGKGLLQVFFIYLKVVSYYCIVTFEFGRSVVNKIVWPLCQNP